MSFFRRLNESKLAVKKKEEAGIPVVDVNSLSSNKWLITFNSYEGLLVVSETSPPALIFATLYLVKKSSSPASIL